MVKENPVLVNFKINPKLLKEFDGKLRGRPRGVVFVKFIEQVVAGKILIDELF